MGAHDAIDYNEFYEHREVLFVSLEVKIYLRDNKITETIQIAVV